MVSSEERKRKLYKGLVYFIINIDYVEMRKHPLKVIDQIQRIREP
jgi:hypothetical protein